MGTRPIRILGIDPGLRRTGWGLVAIEGNRLSCLACGSLGATTRRRWRCGSSLSLMDSARGWPRFAATPGGASGVEAAPSAARGGTFCVRLCLSDRQVDRCKITGDDALRQLEHRDAASHERKRLALPVAVDVDDRPSLLVGDLIEPLGFVAEFFQQGRQHRLELFASA